MLELIQLTETLVVATAVTLAVVATPAAIISGDPPPDLLPLIESLHDEKGNVSE